MEKPAWLKVTHKANYNLDVVEGLLKELSIHTVCDRAKCPNRSECYGSNTATFLILGKSCSRHCRFCNIEYRETIAIDPLEPEKIKEAVMKLGLLHVVITSVTRDDLEDGGAAHFAEVIKAVRNISKKPIVDVLIPDFKGDGRALELIMASEPDVIGHNMETVERLYSEVRPEADYQRSLEVLETVADSHSDIKVKSGFMLGLGEKEHEVVQLMSDLRGAGCEIVTIGQYLAPTANHYPVIDYVHPDVFDYYKEVAYSMGFTYVASGPFVRSSYKANEALGSAHM